MSDALAAFPKRYEPGEMPWFCEICSQPCGKHGYVVIEAAAAIRFCAHCIQMLVAAAPDIAREALERTKTLGGPND